MRNFVDSNNPILIRHYRKKNEDEFGPEDPKNKGDESHFRFASKRRILSELALLRGVKHLDVDFQSINPQVRRFYRIKIAYGNYTAMMEKLRKHSVKIIFNVFVGLPGDDMNGLLETLRSAYYLQPYKVNIRPFYVCPGTYFFTHAKKYRIGFQRQTPYQITRHFRATSRDIHWQIRIAKASARTYNYWSELAWASRAK